MKENLVIILVKRRDRAKFSPISQVWLFACISQEKGSQVADAHI